MANGKKSLSTKPSELNEVEEAISNEKIPSLYANSYTLVLGTSDVIILFKNTSSPVATINLSFSETKSLAIKLMDLIKHLEATTGNTIMSTEEINKYFEQSSNKP